MERIKKDGGFFLLGAIGYVILEILWRGKSHWSMAAAGGISLLLLIKIFRKLKNLPILIKSLLGGAVITGLEFLFGMFFNRLLGMAVWDYSSARWNILGQICPLYSFFWCVISLCVSVFQKILSGKSELVIQKSFS